jgi:septal ring factor EnvC (AmiA/AmiB activator)
MTEERLKALEERVNALVQRMVDYASGAAQLRLELKTLEGRMWRWEDMETLGRRQQQLEAKFDYLIDAICRAKTAEPPPVMVLPRQEGEPVTFQPFRKVDPTVAGVMRAEDRNWVKAVEDAVRASKEESDDQ